VGSEVQISRQLGGGYIISEALLRKCMQLIETFSQDELPKISITFKDGRTMESRNPEDVLSDSFIQSTRIDEIKISGSNFESKRTNDAAIVFRRGGSTAIRFIVAGERAATLMFERDLINELAASKQWYSPLVVSYYPWYLVGISIVILILVLAAGASNLHYIDAVTFDFIFSKIYIPAFLWPLSLLFLNAVFPPIIFDLGDGARRQRRHTAIWSFIIGSIVVALLVGLFAGFLKDWPSTHS
jgi:hypothetical protein